MDPAVMVRFTIGLVFVLLAGGGAFADGAAVPATEPAGSSISFGSDWSGLYGGVQLGTLDSESIGSNSTLGVHAGYRLDFGRLVLGGEVDFDRVGADLGNGVELASVLRGKLQAGYDFGEAFAYVTAGVAEADSTVGEDSGAFYGLGLAYRLTDRFTIGGEFLEHDFGDLSGAPTNGDATTITIRGSLDF